MRRKQLLLYLLLLIISTALAGCKPDAASPVENELATNAPEIEPEPTDELTLEPTPELIPNESNLVEFSTDDGIFHILMPEGWATNQVLLDTGISFGIVPTAEGFNAGPALFNDPVIMVYGSVEQVSPEMAVKENVANFHNYNFYGETSAFNYVMVGQPVMSMEDPPYVYFSQAIADLPTGVRTNWLLATTLADQTVVLYAIGVPDFAMEQYGTLAREMFNSVQIDTEITSQIVQ
jgi:hypothetical protein